MNVKILILLNSRLKRVQFTELLMNYLLILLSMWNQSYQTCRLNAKCSCYYCWVVEPFMHMM